MKDKDTIKQILTSLLSDIPKLFEADELAYLSLQQKNERQIRDKVAWNLQKELDANFFDEKGPQLIVRCEWPSSVDSQKLDKIENLPGRSAVDLAVLKMNEERTDYTEVLALIEFKAHSFLNKEEWPYEEFVKDVKKMITLTQLSRLSQPDDKRIQNADLYFVLVLSSHNKSGCNKYASAVVYKDLLDKGVKRKSRFRPILYDPTNPREYLCNRNTFANGFMQLPAPEWLGKKTLQLDTIQCSPSMPMALTNVVSAGYSFEYEMFVSSIIWGPYNYNNIEIKEHKCPAAN